ncbi:UDP-N-acetylmuramate dehydrogenase [Massilia sp. YIM B02763]|uniref:UDP-N-acetylmuramate dehydrogenase n=1 Tax=Massilia sp. YIM B02763 TaxID=3050130 RepID=UPI0025B7346F|nr:UDP-N-acetylmuramate dehydrogenase [Massilia sp. YIM B02763]MDN4052367.1 UDP-N-acetylmuramate dehydrogenase [Massilia sp. YIM B02763]
MQADLLSSDVQLQSFNTFGIAARARRYLRVTDPAQLAAIAADPALAALPRLVLGGGSNLLITSDTVERLVLHMGLMGKEIVGETADAILVRARAGEHWHGFVEWTIAQGLGGLENMALIPGTVGASPIQNIGAYGAEVKDRFHALTVFDFATGATRTMDAAACRFGYRDSVFKHEEGRDLVVLDVTFALPRAWGPNLRYAELANAVQEAGIAAPTPRQVADAVIAVRRRKLPDPAVIGNAGSFFKNPVVGPEHCARLLAEWPDLVHHVQADGSEKLAAGWLIDRCGWKGKSLGRAGVYPKQALVLVNNGGADGAEVLALARAIQHDVRERFGVLLEPEPVMV